MLQYLGCSCPFPGPIYRVAISVEWYCYLTLLDFMRCRVVSRNEKGLALARTYGTWTCYFCV